MKVAKNGCRGRCLVALLSAMSYFLPGMAPGNETWGVGQPQPAAHGVLAAWRGQSADDRETDGAVCSDCSAETSACTCCGVPLWQHRTGVQAEMLYLRPGNVDVVYAVEQTSFLPALASPTGPVGRVNDNGGTGFRIGANWALDDSASLVVTYSWLESDTVDAITATPGNVLNLQVGHPSVATSGAASLAASATYDIDFQLVDVAYRGLLWGTHDAAIDYVVGLRYAHLSQDFTAEQDIFAGVGLTSVATQINFDGFGPRFGLHGVKRRAGTGLLLYANGDVSLVGGECQANYLQTNQFGGAAQIGNDLDDYRILTLADVELGLGWESAGGRFRVTGGYLVSAWFNTLTTGSYVTGVQQGAYDDLSESLTFDGLVARIEWLY